MRLGRLLYVLLIFFLNTVHCCLWMQLSGEILQSGLWRLGLSSINEKRTLFSHLWCGHTPYRKGWSLGKFRKASLG